MPLTVFPAFSRHVIALSVFVLLAQLTSQQQSNCGGHDPCPGHRPRLATSHCCPAQGGQTCRPSTGQLCDTPLDQVCVSATGQPVTEGEAGTCTGRQNLTVVTKTTTSVTVTWRAFGPDEEHVILYREGRYSEDTATWRERDGGEGDPPTFTLEHLRPATAYFLKISFYDIAIDAISSNYSETLLVTTLDATSCEKGGQEYPVGSFSPPGCEQTCTCHVNASVTCTDRCPHRPEGRKIWEGCQVVDSDDCCDTKLACEPDFVEPTSMSRVTEPRTATCTDEGEVHLYNTTFTSANCGTCSCRGQGFVVCLPECPHVTLPQGPDSRCLGGVYRKVMAGCCQTLLCEVEADTAEARRALVRSAYMRNRMAHALTISLEMNDVPQVFTINVEYRDSANERWLQQQFPCCHNSDDHGGPQALLPPSTAVMTHRQASIQLTGLTPNTTYFVRAGVSPGGHEEGVYMSNSFVFSTLTSRKSCYYSGHEILHGQPVQSPCSQSCVCHDGQVTCTDLCDDVGSTVVPSVTCPRHVMVKAEGDCCPRLTCLPEEFDAVTGRLAGCAYHGLILSDNDVITDQCQACRCSNGTVQCGSACPALPPAPTGCMAKVLAGHCCPEFTCEKVVKHPEVAEVVLSLQFDGVCPDNSVVFLDTLVNEMTEELRGNLHNLPVVHAQVSDLRVNVTDCRMSTKDVQVNSKEKSVQEEKDGLRADTVGDQEANVHVDPATGRNTENTTRSDVVSAIGDSLEQGGAELSGLERERDGMVGHVGETSEGEVHSNSVDKNTPEVYNEVHVSVQTEHAAEPAEEARVVQNATERPPRERRQAETNMDSTSSVKVTVKLLFYGRSATTAPVMTSLEMERLGSAVADVIKTVEINMTWTQVAVTSANFVCDADFAYIDGHCELRKFPQRQAPPPEMTVSDVTTTSAKLSWQLELGSEVEVQYREYNDSPQTEFFDWLTLRHLGTVMTSLSLNQLKPNQTYEVRLLILTSTYLVGQQSQVVDDLKFTTNLHNEKTSSVNPFLISTAVLGVLLLVAAGLLVLLQRRSRPRGKTELANNARENPGYRPNSGLGV